VEPFHYFLVLNNANKRKKSWLVLFSHSNVVSLPDWAQLGLNASARLLTTGQKTMSTTHLSWPPRAGSLSLRPFILTWWNLFLKGLTYQTDQKALKDHRPVHSLRSTKPESSLFAVGKFNSIQFSLFCIAQYHKLRTCLRGLYNLYTYDIPDLWPHIGSGSNQNQSTNTVDANTATVYE